MVLPILPSAAVPTANHTRADPLFSSIPALKTEQGFASSEKRYSLLLKGMGMGMGMGTLLRLHNSVPSLFSHPPSQPPIESYPPNTLLTDKLTNYQPSSPSLPPSRSHQKYSALVLPLPLPLRVLRSRLCPAFSLLSLLNNTSHHNTTHPTRLVITKVNETLRFPHHLPFDTIHTTQFCIMYCTVTVKRTQILIS